MSAAMLGGAGLASIAGGAGGASRRPASPTLGASKVDGNPGGRVGTNMAEYAAVPMDKVRIGVIGLGSRGSDAISRLSRIEDVEIAALGDLFEDRVNRSQGILESNGRRSARGFSGSADAWKGICDLDLDLVYITTPWRWHTPMAVGAMRSGKHAASEVPAAVTVEECWSLVETSEATKRHCMMLENTCYDFEELATLNMVRKGIFGEIVHAEGAYIHDLREYMFDRHGYQGMWRLIENRDRNGNLYPTHGVGPISQCLNINRGDRYEYLSSLSSGDFMMGPRARELAPSDPFYKPYVSDHYRGQMNVTILRTVKGKSVMVQHDTTSPRPYSRIHLLSGTKGMVQKWPVLRMSFGEDWLNDGETQKKLEEYQHPLAAAIGEKAKKIGGHGGMDFIMDYRLVYCLRKGLPLDENVYDAATWSAIGPLSEKSVAGRSSPVDFPDFTRGGWEKTAPLGIVEVV
jgi:predicted dehydrogenase